jgi:D-inositol-3-phosphate glycosyltransferase
MDVFESSGIEVRIIHGFPLRDFEMYESQALDLAVWSRLRGHNAVLANTIGAFIGADIASRLGLPCVWGIHESWPPDEFWKVNFPRGYVDPKVRAAADRVLMTTPAVVFEAEATRRLYLSATQPGATCVIPYGVDIASIDNYLSRTSRTEARRWHGLSDNDVVVLVLGTIEARKNQTLIAEAFAAAADSYPDSMLVFVGDTGSAYAVALRHFVREAHLNARIRIEKVTKDIDSWYRAADLFMSASDIESLPRTLLEAMAFGLPILATSVFGVPELIDDGLNGFLFEPRSLRAASESLKRVLCMPGDELRRVGSAGTETVNRNHQSQKYAEEIIELLHRLPAAGSRSATSILEEIRSSIGTADDLRASRIGQVASEGQVRVAGSRREDSRDAGAWRLPS